MSDSGAARGSPALPWPDAVWDVSYASHPLLDPTLWDRHSRLSRWIEYTWNRIQDDDAAYRREAARLLRPLLAPREESDTVAGDLARIAGYLREANVYLKSAIRLLPATAQAHVDLLPEVAGCDDLRELLAIVFTGGDPRRRFEAQRKICLANLLLDIDASRPIQDGPLHLAYFEELLQAALWRYRSEQHEVAIGYRLDPDGETIRYTSRPGTGDQVFTFRSSLLERRDGRRTTTIDVLYSSCRFKLSVLPLSFETVDGRQRVQEPARWSEMRQRRSGSVLSKMIRRGINDPSQIADLLGAMFIVFDESAVDDLIELLDAGLGNPFGWRNVTDAFRAVPAGAGLNPHAGRGYQVFKGDVDILIPSEAPHRPPYRFTVEIQVHTLQSFLRTVCATHHSHHRALKLRQFLGGLVPYLFPAAVYGTRWLRFDPDSDPLAEVAQASG